MRLREQISITRRRATFLGLLACCLVTILSGAEAIAETRPGSASELPPEDVLRNLQRWIGSSSNLYAKFEQATQSGSFGTGVPESGELFLSRPNRMRWDYLEPERKIAIVDHGLTLLYLEEDEQMYLGQIDSTASLLPSLLTGDQPLQELFSPSLLATPDQGGEGFYKLRLEPIESEDGPVQYVVLTLDATQFSIVAADVMDGAGNSMRYRFSSYDRDRELAETLFQFQAPRGTEIIRQ